MVTRILQRLLKVHAGEARKVLFFAFLGALLEVGIALGISTADSLFLVHVGADRLPVVYILLPLIMVAFIPVYSYLATRFGVDGLFKLTLVILMVGGVLCFLGVVLLGERTSVSFYFAKLYASLWAISLFTLYWNYVDRYFDILDAKRLFPVFAGGAACGAAAGGGAVTVLVGHLAVEDLFLVWSVIALLTLPVVLRINRRWKKIDIDADPDDDAGFLRQTLEVGRIMKRSRYVVLLNLVLVLTVFLTTVCEFQYLGIFSRDAEAEDLAILFGTLFLAVNLFNLVVNFFLFSRLVVLAGVRNMALVQPLTYLAAFGFLYWHYGWSAAVVGFFAYQGIQSSLDNNNWNFLMNGVPADFKSRVRTFTEGLSEPMAASLAGVYLFLFAPRMSEAQISAAGMGGALVLLTAALFLRRDYVGAIITSLRREWLDFSRSERELLQRVAPSELDMLRRRADSSDGEAARAALRLLGLVDKRAALDSLMGFFRRADEEQKRRAHPLLAEILQDAEVEVLTAVVRSLGEDQATVDSTFVEVLGSHGLIRSEVLHSLLESADPRDRAAAAVAQWNSWDPADGLRAMEVIGDLLGRSEGEKATAVRALGQLRQERYAHFLAQYLTDPSTEVRREALAAIRDLAGRDSGHLTGDVLRVLRRGDGHERELAIEVLARIKDSGCIREILSLPEGLTPPERRRVEQLILDIGLGSIPTIVGVVRDSSFGYAARSIAARSLCKLAFPQFEALLPELQRTELERAYRYLHLRSVLDGEPNPGPGPAVMSLFYRDIRKVIVEFVLEILTLGGRLPDFEMISASLRSNSPKVRANAIESVEQACSRQVFKLLLPLVDSRDPGETVRFYMRRYQPAPIGRDELVRLALDSPFELESAAAAQAVWENDGIDGRAEFQERAARLRSSLFGETVLSLVRKSEGSDEMTVIEVIHELSGARFFRRFGPAELLTFARHCRPALFPEGDRVYRRGDDADRLFVVRQGRVRLEGAEIVTLRTGDTFGEESLFQRGERLEDAVSEGFAGLVVDARSVARRAGRNSRMALGLLETRLEGR